MTSTAARTSHDQQPETAGDASRYPAQVRSITWHLLADGYAVTWAPDPAGCSLTLDRHGPRGEHDAYRGAGPTMQRAWDEVRAQLGHGQPQPAGGLTREAPGPARGSDRNGGVRYWNPLNAPAWEADPSHGRPGPLVAALLTFPLDASPLMSGSCIRRDRRRVFPGHKAGIRTGGTLFRRSCDLLTCGFSPS
jgi:hypothetical protein